MAFQLVSVPICTGVCLSMLVPSPTCPLLLNPQPHSVPLVFKPIVQSLVPEVFPIGVGTNLCKIIYNMVVTKSTITQFAIYIAACAPKSSITFDGKCIVFTRAYGCPIGSVPTCVGFKMAGPSAEPTPNAPHPKLLLPQVKIVPLGLSPML